MKECCQPRTIRRSFAFGDAAPHAAMIRHCDCCTEQGCDGGGDDDVSFFVKSVFASLTSKSTRSQPLALGKKITAIPRMCSASLGPILGPGPSSTSLFQSLVKSLETTYPAVLVAAGLRYAERARYQIMRQTCDAVRDGANTAKPRGCHVRHARNPTALLKSNIQRSDQDGGLPCRASVGGGGAPFCFGNGHYSLEAQADGRRAGRQACRQHGGPARLISMHDSSCHFLSLRVPSLLLLIQFQSVVLLQNCVFPASCFPIIPWSCARRVHTYTHPPQRGSPLSPKTP